MERQGLERQDNLRWQIEEFEKEYEAMVEKIHFKCKLLWVSEPIKIFQIISSQKEKLTKGDMSSYMGLLTTLST